MVWNQEDIKEFKEGLVVVVVVEEENAAGGKVDAWVSPSQEDFTMRSSPASRKWKSTSTDENLRPDAWLGVGSPMGKKKSWKVKSIIILKPVVVVPDLDNDE